MHSAMGEKGPRLLDDLADLQETAYADYFSYRSSIACRVAVSVAVCGQSAVDLSCV
jgi:hypothetical protein